MFGISDKKKTTLGWGEFSKGGEEELWDDRPIFLNQDVRLKDWLWLLFYPKKFLLYRWVRRAVNEAKKQHQYNVPIRVLDVGCGTGSAVIDLKKIFGRSVEVIGVEVVELQIDIAKQRLKEYGVWSEIHWYDGEHLPFSDESIDVIYSCDVLGHVKDVPRWLAELYRVLKSDASLVMFAESKPGKHAVLRNYVAKCGVNIDPHAQFHISLYAKHELWELLTQSGFTIKKMFATVWAKLLVNPEEFYNALKKEKNLPLLRLLSGMLSGIKKKLHPYSTAVGELYSLIEMVTVGRFLESQGYIILAKKNTEKVLDEETRRKRTYPQLAMDYSGNLIVEESN